MTHFASIAAAALGVALVPAAAHAQTAPAPATQAAEAKVGATVFDSAGAEVGTIESITNGVAVVFTGSNRASIPLTSFGTSPKGPTLGLTKAQLDQAAMQAKANADAQLRAQLTSGAQVRGKNGAVVATVKAVEGDEVVLSSAKGDARIPITGIGANPQGLFIGMTQAEFDAAVAGAATTAPSQ